MTTTSAADVTVNEVASKTASTSFQYKTTFDAMKKRQEKRRLNGYVKRRRDGTVLSSTWLFIFLSTLIQFTSHYDTLSAESRLAFYVCYPLNVLITVLASAGFFVCDGQDATVFFLVYVWASSLLVIVDENPFGLRRRSPAPRPCAPGQVWHRIHHL